MLKHRQPVDDESLADRDSVDETYEDDNRTAYVDRGDRRDRPYVDDRSGAVVARADEMTTSERAFSIGQILIMLCGAALLFLGIVATVDGGLDGSVTEPTVEVVGFNHTPLLGLIEIGAGAVLLLAGLRPAGRTFAGFVGVLLIVAGAVVLAELDWSVENLATERDFGWVPIAIGAVTLLAAMVPATTRRVTTVESSSRTAG